jgi:hypothetical protein
VKELMTFGAEKWRWVNPSSIKNFAVCVKVFDVTKPFDVTLKHMLEHYPADCARLVGVQTAAPIAVIDGDVSTVTAMADKVLRIDERKPWLLHLEFQASYEAHLPRRMLRYNVLLNGRHEMPVRSAVLLLRKLADGPEMTGTVRQTLPDGRPYLEFWYDVIHVWQLAVEELLQGGVGTLPLAPIAVERNEVPDVVQRMKQRLASEVPPSEAGLIWAETDILLGLRYQPTVAAELLRGVQGMRESSTYMAILEEGALEEGQRFLLRIGSKHLGTPDSNVKAAVKAITDLDRLEALGERVTDVNSWEKLLAQTQPKRRNGRKRKR